MYCSRCGKELIEDSKYCFNCGVKIDINKDLTEQVITLNNEIKVSDEHSVTVEETIEVNKLQGIGGWLYLVGFTLVIGPISQAIMLYEDIKSILESTNQVDTVTLLCLSYDILATAAFVFFPIVCLSFFLKKKKAFVRLFFALQCSFISVELYFLLITLIISPSYILQQIGAFIARLIVSTIYIIYIFNSKRVKNTFVS